VRLIGVDTPEMSDPSRNRQTARRNKLDEKNVSAFAKKAKTFVEGLVEGREVRLEYDWQRQDKYGRTLAYVYRQDDGLFLNAEIIRRGYGLPIVYFPFKYKEDFQKLCDQAREGSEGLWKSG
jgi:micrococcal nuclease